MIKNVVFDIGNVLLSFRPAEFLENKNYSEKLRKTILAEVFGSREWKLLDDGAISVPKAIDAISLLSSLRRGDIAHIFDLRTEIMIPLVRNVKLLPELKKLGFKLYFLSNFPQDIFGEIRDRNSFFKYFDGGIISADVKVSKPNAGIYKILLEKYSLVPEECLFIDDLEANVVSAESVGMKGFYTSGAPDITAEVSKRLGRKHLKQYCSLILFLFQRER